MFQLFSIQVHDTVDSTGIAGGTLLVSSVRDECGTKLFRFIAVAVILPVSMPGRDLRNQDGRMLRAVSIACHNDGSFRSYHVVWVFAYTTEAIIR